jgi:MFS transporter, DHA1 family, tetracycline resistance protein
VSSAPAQTPATSAPTRAAMPFILVAVLIDMVSIGLIIPVLPPLVGTFTVNQTDQAWWYGAIMLAFGIANFFGSPILGALSDRYGRRPILLVGFCGLALSFFVTAMATALWMLIVVRLFTGAMQSNAAVANAYVADISPPEERARRFGLLGAMFGLGFILGPVMGGVLGAVDLHLPFYVAGALALVNWLYGYFVLPESLPADRRSPVEWRKANPVTSLRGLAELKGVGPLLAVLALSAMAQFVLHSTWVLYTAFKFGWGPLENGWSLFAVGVMSTLVQGVLLKHLLRRFSAPRLAVMGLASSSLCYLAWGLAPAGWLMIVVIVFNLLGFAVASAMQSIVSNAASESAQGRTMGAVSSLNSLMAVIAPVVGAAMLGFVSHLPQGDWRIGAPFYFCALLQAAAMLIALRHFAHARALKSLHPART